MVKSSRLSPGWRSPNAHEERSMAERRCRSGEADPKLVDMMGADRDVTDWESGLDVERSPLTATQF